MNKELIEKMKVALADTYAFALKSQNYHWNVEGPDFSQYHAFFGGLYEEVVDGVDIIAEGIRQLDAYAPASFTRFKELADIEDELIIRQPLDMFKQLSADNIKVLESLTAAYNQAEKDKKFGISNFLQDRITAHEKHGWMIRSHIKAQK
jgi:starvation-inducible DNA-binding protein